MSSHDIEIRTVVFAMTVGAYNTLWSIVRIVVKDKDDDTLSMKFGKAMACGWVTLLPLIILAFVCACHYLDVPYYEVHGADGHK